MTSTAAGLAAGRLLVLRLRMPDASRQILLAGLTLVVQACEVASPPSSPVARSPDAMVVTGSALATEVGVRVLESGGNAVDAAVAAAFALAVVEPSQSGLGGRTQILIRTPDGRVHGIDATTEVPASYDPATAPYGETGHSAVGIPGTVAGLARAVQEHGTLGWSAVIEPALALARYGFPLSAGEAERIAELAGALRGEVASLLLRSDGRPHEPGDRFAQPELAETLETLASEGPHAFYRGRIAEEIARDMAAHGGFVTREDLAGYRALDALVVHGRYRGLELAGTYLPAAGATVIEALQILEHAGAGGMDDATWVTVTAGVLAAAFEDREEADASDETPEAAARRLTSPEWADRRAAELGLPVERAGDARRSLVTVKVPSPSEPEHTSHLSVVDADGRAVAMTQSLGPTLGARVATPGLGFLYGSTMGGYLAEGGPGTRAWSSQAPMVATRDGQLTFVLGGAGARRILSALVGILSRVVDRGASLPEAVAAPRFHPTAGTLFVESVASWPDGDALRRAAGSAGFEVEERERSWFARLNVIGLESDGTRVGVTDPRWSGGAAAAPRVR